MQVDGVVTAAEGVAYAIAGKCDGVAFARYACTR